MLYMFQGKRLFLRHWKKVVILKSTSDGHQHVCLLCFCAKITWNHPRGGGEGGRNNFFHSGWFSFINEEISSKSKVVILEVSTTHGHQDRKLQHCQHNFLSKQQCSTYIQLTEREGHLGPGSDRGTQELHTQKSQGQSGEEKRRLFGVATFHHNFILVKNIVIRSRTMRMTEARESSDSDGRGSGGVFIFLHGVFSKYYFLDTVSKRSPKLLSRGSIFRLEAAAKNGRGCLASCHPLQGCLICWSDFFDILMRYAKI